MYVNARSIGKPGALDALNAYTAKTSTDLVMISETWLDDSVMNAELSCGGRYNVFRKDRSGRGGGVCVLANKSLKGSAVHLEGLKDIEAVAVDLYSAGACVRVACFYVSPSGTAAEKQHRLQKVCRGLDALCDTEQPVIVLGDFNQPSIKWGEIKIGTTESHQTMFIDCCISNGLEQLIKEVTRPVGGCDVFEVDKKGMAAGGTLLDLLLTTDPAIIDPLELHAPPVASDHKAISFGILFEGSPPPTNPESLNFWKADYETIQGMLLNVPWRTLFSRCVNVDEMYTVFIGKLHDAINFFVPKRAAKSTNLSLVRYIKKLEGLMALTPSSTLASKLQRASRRLRVLEESCLSFRNTREFFRYANRRLKGAECIGPLEIKGDVITDDLKLANAFKEFFATVFVSDKGKDAPDVRAQALNPDNIPQGTVKEHYLNIGEVHVLEKIKELPSKCSLTPDLVPPLFYKRVGAAIAEPLSLIYARSYEDGVVPHLFKKSLVTPIFKKGPKTNVENYRPIAQLSIACIIFEKILVTHLANLLLSNGLVDVNQHGFTKGRSTATQLLETVQDWAEYVNKTQQFDCVYFDLAKAFDRVDHSRLLKKLELCNVDKRSIAWIKDYLSARTFRVRVNGSLSDEAECCSGVPQGSCLGPLLFSIFILDLKSMLPEGVNYKLYADDLKIYGPSGSAQDREMLQAAVDGTAAWCLENNMKISISKCMVLGFKTPHSYILNGELLPVAHVTKDLGVYITAELNFDRHVTAVIQSAHNICNTILRCFIVKEPNFYIRLFNSLVLPRFLYCSQVWRPYLKKHKRALERVQTRFLRRVSMRCAVSRSDLQLPSVEELQRTADLRLYESLRKASSFSKYFCERANNLRSNCTITSTEIARTERINNVFSWRVVRELRQTMPKQN